MHIVVAIVVLLLSACSTIEQRAYGSAAADTASTAVVLALGGVELNPVGWFTVPLKGYALAYAETLPENEKRAYQASVSPVWYGAAANNICIAVAILTSAGGAVPLCLLAGITAGGVNWNSNQKEIQFYEICADYLRRTGDTDLVCDHNLEMVE